MLCDVALSARMSPRGERVGAPSSEDASKEALAPLFVVSQLHGGHFVTSSDGARFQMRGFDYQPLVTSEVQGKVRQYRNETFAPSFYKPNKISKMLATWEAEGYNTVRVFLNPSQIGNVRGGGLNRIYIANVANFLRTAQRFDVRTLITVGALPEYGGYVPPASPSFGTANEDYLDPAFIVSQCRYLTDLIGALRRDGAPLLDALWELKGEQNWDNYAAPLDWKSGEVKTADGRTYNMASPSSRVAMENANLAYWTNALSATIHRLVPGSLTGVGVYPPSVRRPKWTVRPQVLFTSATQSNFVDIHVYPNLGPELTQMQSFDASSTTKPVIMGEFGATRSSSVRLASKGLVRWQERSCHIAGLSISGWLLWTWNSSADVEFWDALAHGALIERALAPVERPNPCG